VTHARLALVGVELPRKHVLEDGAGSA
jgi:hypothetical protein